MMRPLLSPQNVPDVTEFMAAVLVTHRKYLNMTQTVFCSHKAFLSALHEVDIINFTLMWEGLIVWE